ncbi:MAG: flavin reductase [Isosphaeraceae bacterium]|jgi:flavin reductase (DIM6/NTAB) family NADH-FMN oxidoreductase RutF|nr:MAG: flavin reductase [Isosphaeraceae bacterium]
MILDPGQAEVVRVYRALIELVVPRPIAWVTSIDPEGRINLAPFSFFNVFGANPPIVVFSPTLRRDGTAKDTLENVRSTGEFVINLAVEDLVDSVNASSADYPRGVNEADRLGLALAPSERVRPPRVAASPAHLECQVVEIRSYGEGPIAANLVIGRVVLIHVDDAVLDQAGSVDPRKLRAVARLGGDFYCRSTDLFTLRRPERPPDSQPPAGPAGDPRQ